MYHVWPQDYLFLIGGWHNDSLKCTGSSDCTKIVYSFACRRICFIVFNVRSRTYHQGRFLILKEPERRQGDVLESIQWDNSGIMFAALCAPNFFALWLEELQGSGLAKIRSTKSPKHKALSVRIWCSYHFAVADILKILTPFARVHAGIPSTTGTRSKSTCHCQDKLVRLVAGIWDPWSYTLPCVCPWHMCLFPLETGWDKGLGLRQLRANRLWRNMKERVVWFFLRFLAATAFVLTQGTKQKGVGALAAAVGVIPGELLQLMIDSGSFWKSLNKSKHALILLQGAVYRFCASTTAIAES